MLLGSDLYLKFDILMRFILAFQEHTYRTYHYAYLDTLLTTPFFLYHQHNTQNYNHTNHNQKKKLKCLK